MLSNVDCYGRLGIQADAGAHLKATLSRSTDGLQKALSAFDATLSRIRTGGYTPWTAPVGEMTLLHTQWIASLTWQWAVAFIDAAVLSGEGDDLTDLPYSLVLQYCADAADESVKATNMETQLANGKRPGNTIIEAPQLHLHASLVLPVWALIETTVMRVSADMALIRQAGISDRFKTPFQALETVFLPKVKVFKYHQDQWRASLDVASQRQILQDALPLLTDFFKIGQQIWTPYLIGRDFIDVLRAYAVFEKYGLDIDPWSLTDPSVANLRSLDRESCVKLAEFWTQIAEPRLAVALQNEVNDAVSLGKLEIIVGRHYQIPPWHGQYKVLSQITLGGNQYDPGTVIAVNFRGPAGQRTVELRSTGTA